MSVPHSSLNIQLELLPLSLRPSLLLRRRDPRPSLGANRPALTGWSETITVWQTAL